MITPSPRFDWTPQFSSLFLGGFGAGAQKHLPLSYEPTPPVCPVYLHSNLPFSNAINTLTTPLAPRPSRLQDAEKHRDLHMTCHLESRPLQHKPSSGTGNDVREWPISQAQTRRKGGGFLCFEFLYNMFIIIVAFINFKGIFRAKSFPLTSPWPRWEQGGA